MGCLLSQRDAYFHCENWHPDAYIHVNIGIGTPVTPSGGERIVLHSMETLFDAGLVAFESIPGKGTYYGTLRCGTLPSKENFPRQRPAPWLLRDFLAPVQCRTFLPTKGRDRNFLLSL